MCEGVKTWPSSLTGGLNYNRKRSSFCWLHCGILGNRLFKQNVACGTVSSSKLIMKIMSACVCKRATWIYTRVELILSVFFAVKYSAKFIYTISLVVIETLTENKIALRKRFSEWFKGTLWKMYWIFFDIFS